MRHAICLVAVLMNVLVAPPAGLSQGQGGPQITSVTPTAGRLDGGEDVTVEGQQFSTGTVVVLGDGVGESVAVESESRLRFRAPAQQRPGGRTLTVLTSAGAAQRRFTVRGETIAEAAPADITTVAGGVPYLGDGSPAASAAVRLSAAGVAVDATGALFVADDEHHRVRRVDATTGRITTVAGSGAAGFGGDGAPAVRADLNTPLGVAVDAAGALYIADRNNHRIRLVDPRTNVITTVAGTGVPGFGGDGGAAVAARIDRPEAVAVDATGTLYFVDRGNNRIRRVDAQTGVISTVAGSGGAGFGGDGGPAVAARLGFPSGIAVDAAGTLFFVDTENHRVRRVDARTGVISTVAGSGQRSFGGDGGPATSAAMAFPSSVAVDAAGNLYVTDTFNDRVRRVDAQTGTISTVAGGGGRGFDGDGGPATIAQLDTPSGVAVNASGDIFIADRLNDRIRRVSAASRTIATVAGGGGASGDGEQAVGALLARPAAVALDSGGNLFIAETESHRIRRVDAVTGVVTTVAGTGARGFGGDGGPATGARLASASGVAVDAAGNLYIADTNNDRIRRVDAQTGIISTVVGRDERSFTGDGGPAANATLALPSGVAVDASGNVLVADTANDRVRRIDARTGIISTVAGGTAASLDAPVGIAIDAAGNLYIADSGNNRIRRVDAGGTITNVAGSGAGGFGGDGGPATAASLATPTGVAVDGSGNVFAADSGNERVRRVDAATGTIATVAGTGESGYTGDDEWSRRAKLNQPSGLAVDGAGTLLVADRLNDAIRAIKAGERAEPTVTVTGAQYVKPLLTISGSGFGTTGATVRVNARDVSGFVESQTDGRVVVRGKKKKLGITKGQNTVTVTAGGVTSNAFVFVR